MASFYVCADRGRVILGIQHKPGHLIEAMMTIEQAQSLITNLTLLTRSPGAAAPVAIRRRHLRHGHTPNSN